METTHESVAQQQPQQQPKPKGKKFVIIFIVLLVVLIAAGVFWFLQDKSRQSDTSNAATNTNTATNTNNAAQANSVTNEVVTEPSTTTTTYTNSAYKFSLTYPKTYQDYGNCDDVKKVRDAIDNNQSRPKISNVAVKVFEVPGQNKLYLAPENAIEIKMYQVENSGVYNFDYTSCKVVPVTLDIIQHWNDHAGDVTKLHPLMLEMPFDIYYKTVTSDTDFIALLSSTGNGAPLKSGCVVKRTPTLKDSNVEVISIEGEPCYSGGGAPSLYVYSKVSKTAVLTGGYQILPFGLEDSFIHFTQ